MGAYSVAHASHTGLHHSVQWSPQTLCAYTGRIRIKVFLLLSGDVVLHVLPALLASGVRGTIHRGPVALGAGNVQERCTQDSSFLPAYYCLRSLPFRV